MKSISKKQLRCKLLCALVAGALAAPFAAPHAYALPIEGANAAANADAATIRTNGTAMNIVGKTDHNVLRWEDFSVDKDEIVRFDGGAQTRDYLNLVTGEGASNIYGTIEGGRNVYLVNPHGILFAEGSQVNTGALYLSTANHADIAAATNTFKADGTSPLSATAQTGDVLNLGAVKAAKLYIEGNNVTVLNTDAVTDVHGTALTGNAVTIRSAEAPHIGYDVGNKITKNIKVGSTPTPYQVSDYASTAADHRKASAESRGWVVQYLNGEPHADYDYMRVHDVYELQHIEANLRGRYMLANDINASETSGWNHIGYHDPEGFMPIGGNGSSGPQFKGRFDGVGHRIEHLHINRQEADEDSYIGLFGNINGAMIENLFIKDGYVRGYTHVGGIVGAAEGTLIRNVSFSGTLSGSDYFGGIVGTAKYGMICNAYNAGKVDAGTYVGGIVGAGERVTLQNVWNAGEIRGRGDGRDAFIGGIAGAMKNSTVQNALHTGTVARDGQPSQDEAQTVAGIVGQADGTSVSHAVWKAGSVTQGCSPTFIAHAVGESKNGTEEVDVAKHSLEDMKKAATYTDWKDENGNALVATEGGKGTPWRIYDGKTTPMLTALMKGTKRLEKTYDGKTFGDGDAHILSDTALEKNVGTRDASGIYSDAFGYDLIGSTYRIAPRVLTMSGVASQTKTYDGNTNADATQFSATLNNVVTGEESLVTATATGAAYNSKDVATANKVNYALALSGTGAGNYTLAATTVQGAGTISRRALTLGTVAAQTKTYDGTTAADAGKFRAALTNAIAGDSVAATATGAAYNSKDVAGANTVNYTGVALGGADAGNYSLDAVAQGTGTITRRALTFDAVAAQTKTYDGNMNADAAQFSATLGNIVAGEENSVSATAAGATYNDKNVAGANKVSYTGVALGGTGAGNYSIADTAQGKGTITKRALTLGTVTAQTKIYDGTTAADAGKFSAALTNAIAGDSVAATATGAAYNSKNVAAASTIGYTGVALSGADAGNYSLAATTAQGAGTITARELTLGTVASQSKTYDGTRAADASKFSAALGNAIAGDSVTATATGAAYNDHNVAAARTIDYTGVSLGGSDAGNYSLAATAAQGEGRITPKELNLALTGGARFDKTYDGTANVAQTLAKGTNYSLTGFVTGEGADIELSAVTGKYADKNAARDKAVTFDGLTLTGTGAGNYVLNSPTLTGIGTIMRRALTLGAVAAQSKTYDGMT
ncbi:YDG domain-containing protein, partial [Selenomonas sputigena]|uniref:YDG domain-containing protein n=1 Tax=Selenomonas sputigena TaxID=69823 RepID=UPI002234C741